jgi:hypothetical protein
MRLLYRSPAGEAPRGPYAPASLRRTAAERSGGGVHSSPSRSLTRGRSVMIRVAHRCKHQELADLLLRSRINDAPSAWRHEGVIRPPASLPAQRSAVSIWEASSASRSQAGAVTPQPPGVPLDRASGQNHSGSTPAMPRSCGMPAMNRQAPRHHAPKALTSSPSSAECGNRADVFD